MSWAKDLPIWLHKLRVHTAGKWNLKSTIRLLLVGDFSLRSGITFQKIKSGEVKDGHTLIIPSIQKGLKLDVRAYAWHMALPTLLSQGP